MGLTPTCESLWGENIETSYLFVVNLVEDVQFNIHFNNNNFKGRRHQPDDEPSGPVRLVLLAHLHWSTLPLDPIEILSIYTG